MKNFTRYLCSAAFVSILTASMAFAQVAADVDTIAIPGGLDNEGLIESTINNDVDAEGNRINPNRVYKLETGQVHYMLSGIVFGSELDTMSTLIIVGEKGAVKPMVLMKPPSGVNAFNNQISGNLTVKHVYWAGMNLLGNSAVVWSVKTMDKRVEMDDVVSDNLVGGFWLYLVDAKGHLSIILKNCYFRDYTGFANGWQNMVFWRTNAGEPIDTLWIENTTVVNAGMPFMGKQIPVNFAYINHNTIINSSKYPIWMEQFNEAYIANNLFINANYEGECKSTWPGQLAADGFKNGILNLDTIAPANWEFHFPESLPAPGLEDITFLASNNLNWNSPYLDKYFTGGYNDVADKPLSNRDWSPDVNAEDLPITVDNIPMPLFSERSTNIIDDHDNIKMDNNYDLDTDPQMKTKGMASQEVADQFAYFCRKNYGVAEEGETFDKTMMYMGDLDPATIPGDGQESGQNGFTSITEFPEDFSYESNIRSIIDGLPLGSLSWWPDELASWDSEAALTRIKEYYVTGRGVGIEDHQKPSSDDFQIYPNPAQNILTIASQTELDRVKCFDVTGKLVMENSLKGAFSGDMNVSTLENGMYILVISDVTGTTKSMKFMKN